MKSEALDHRDRQQAAAWLRGVGATTRRIVCLAMVAGSAVAMNVTSAQARQAATPSAPAVNAGDGSYEISGVTLAPGKDAPMLTQAEIDRIEVVLVADEKGFLRAAEKEGEKSERVRLGSLASTPRRFDASGIAGISASLVTACNYKGFFAVVALPAQGEIDDAGKDLRGGRTTLAVELLGAKVRGVQVIPMSTPEQTKPLSTTWAKARMDRVAARIREGSPMGDGDMVKREPLDDYVNRINRRPDRHVDAAIASAAFGSQAQQRVGPVNEVQLNYMFNQGKPWTAYAQVSNTGTPETDEWRERFGFVHDQLTGHDDTLQIDYITAAFDASHSVLGSYSTALDSAGLWRGKINGNWAKYDATQVAGNQDFSGDGSEIGLELSRNVLQKGALFLDAFAGVRYSSQNVDNRTTGDSGEGRFLLPSVGVSASRATPGSTLDAGLRLETNIYSDGDDDFAYANLGRFRPDRYWWSLKGNFDYAFFLDSASTEGGPARNAHQLSFSSRFQYAFDDARLVPTEQSIVGGFMTVRGYDEAMLAGDSSITGSVEYRLYIPQLLGSGGTPSVDSTVPRPDASGRSSSFKWVPDAEGNADWNLLARAFVDGGYVANDNASAVGTDSYEFDSALLSAGLGLELSIKRNFTARVDWGMALVDVDGPGGTKRAESGDNRFHFLFTVMY